MHRLCVFIFAFGKLELVGESCSAFCTSSLQNFATVGGTHSFSEAVFFLSLKLLGLVCSKHCFRTSLNNDRLAAGRRYAAFIIYRVYYTHKMPFLSSLFLFFAPFILKKLIKFTHFCLSQAQKLDTGGIL